MYIHIVCVYNMIYMCVCVKVKDYDEEVMTYSRDQKTLYANGPTVTMLGVGAKRSVSQLSLPL